MIDSYYDLSYYEDHLAALDSMIAIERSEDRFLTELNEQLNLIEYGDQPKLIESYNCNYYIDLDLWK